MAWNLIATRMWTTVGMYDGRWYGSSYERETFYELVETSRLMELSRFVIHLPRTLDGEDIVDLDDPLGCCRFVVEERRSFNRWKFFDDSLSSHNPLDCYRSLSVVRDSEFSNKLLRRFIIFSRFRVGIFILIVF